MMAAASPSLGSHMREELSCSICLELFTRPKVLPCQHTFCQDCLRDLVGGRRNFQCPNCRRQVSLPGRGVFGLPDNHLVTNLCEALQNQASLSGETGEQPQSGNACSFHPAEEVRLYCKQCNVPVCNECLDERHSDHGTISMKKAAQERRASFQDQIDEGRNILGMFSSFLEGLREQEIMLCEQKQQTNDSINKAFNQMVQKLKNDKGRLLMKVNNKHSKNLKWLQKKRDSVSADVRELSAACDSAEQELQQGGVKFPCQDNMLTVLRKYTGKAAPTPVQTQSAVFQPTDTPVPVLGDVTFPSVPSAPIPAVPAARVAGHHYSSEGQSTQSLPSAPIPASLEIEAGTFESPSAVAVSNEGEIFIADQGIQVFTLQGTFVRQFPTVVTMSYPRDMIPQDVALDGEGNLWVVGKAVSYEFVVQYNKQGRVLRWFDLENTWRARGVAVDTMRNNILVTQVTGSNDNLQGEVQVFKPDGRLVRTVGQQQGMRYPRHITVDGEGNILVSDCPNNCIYVYNEEGQLLFQFGSQGGSNGQLSGPMGICTDRAGNIIVADSMNHRVEMFDKTGRFLKLITSDRLTSYPLAVAMAPQGQLVVIDWGKATSRSFLPVSSTTTSAKDITILACILFQ
ncbi:uncharacterized protein LOC144870342 [Branchiostoma floridae x Branchiostoma japonicum]